MISLESCANLPGQVVWVLLAVVWDSTILQLVLTEQEEGTEQHLRRKRGGEGRGEGGEKGKGKGEGGERGKGKEGRGRETERRRGRGKGRGR